MKLLLDTNIILDIALDRKPFVQEAIQLLKTAQQKEFPLFISATSVTDIYYITRKNRDKNTALAFLKDLLEFINVASVDKHVVLKSLESGMADFEDAIQSFSAKNEGITTLITRNESDFKQSGLSIFNPKSFLESLH